MQQRIFASSFKIGSEAVGRPARCFVIAEAGVNHNGDPDLAHKLIDAAADCGANAVKFQTFKAELLVQHAAESVTYQRRDGGNLTQLELLSALELPHSVLAELAQHAKERGIVFMSTPFDERSADLLAEIGVPAFKIGSGDVKSFRLLRHISSLSKPILLSTGMSYLEEVRSALDLLARSGVRELGLFHCVSCYPAPTKDAHLKAIEMLRDTFKVPIGYSDHHQSNLVSFAAVARGAEVLEKHLTLDRNLPGPDHASSLDPISFRLLVQGVREIEESLGTDTKAPQASELECREKSRRSLVSTMTIKVGEAITPDMLTNKRPASGIDPFDEDRVLGSIALLEIPPDSVLQWNMLKLS